MHCVNVQPFEPIFRLVEAVEGELYLWPIEPGAIAAVVEHGNPVCMELKMPFSDTPIFTCLPGPCAVRVYNGNIGLRFLVGESYSRGYEVSSYTRVYRFLVRFGPYDFERHLKRSELQRHKNHAAALNYVIPSSRKGYAGVVIRAVLQQVKKGIGERLEVYSVDCGHEKRRFDEWLRDITKQPIARFTRGMIDDSLYSWDPERK